MLVVDADEVETLTLPMDLSCRLAEQRHPVQAEECFGHFFSASIYLVVSVWLVVRSARDPQQLAALMRTKLRELDPGLPIVEIETWAKGMDFAVFPSRMAAVCLGVMGLMGAMLSITGIFGMAAYTVSKRLKELGIRVALGAQRGEVLMAALGRSLRLLAFGSAGGLALGIMASAFWPTLCSRHLRAIRLCWPAL